MPLRTATCQYRNAYRLPMHVRLGRLTHAHPAFCPCRKQLLVQRMLVSTRMFIVFMWTVLAPECEFCHYHKQAGTIYRKRSFLHSREQKQSTIYCIATSFVSPHSLPCAFIDLPLLQKRGKAGRGNFSFAAEVNISS